MNNIIQEWISGNSNNDYTHQKRTIEILESVISGYSNKHIAKELLEQYGDMGETYAINWAKRVRTKYCEQKRNMLE